MSDSSRARVAIQTMVALVLLLGAILGVAALLWQSARYILSMFSSVDSEVATAIVAAAIAGLASVFTVVYAQWRTKEREIREAHRPQKVKVYGEYMELMFEILRQTKKGGTVSEKSIPPKAFEKMYDFRRGVILWGSPGVIRSYLDWEAVGVHESDPQNGMCQPF